MLFRSRSNKVIVSSSKSDQTAQTIEPHDTELIPILKNLLPDASDESAQLTRHD